jgi:hypothetical protein
MPTATILITGYHGDLITPTRFIAPTTPTNIYADDNQYMRCNFTNNDTTSPFATESGSIFTTNYATAIPAGAVITANTTKFYFRCYSPSWGTTTVGYPLPRSGLGATPEASCDNANMSTWGDYDMTGSEALYEYPSSGAFSITTRDSYAYFAVAGRRSSLGTGTGYLYFDQAYVTVDYTIPPAGNALFFGENF